MFFQIVKRVNIAYAVLIIYYYRMGLAHVKPVLPVVHASRIYCTVVQSQNQGGFAVATFLPQRAVLKHNAPRTVNSRVRDNAFITLAGKLYSVRN